MPKPVKKTKAQRLEEQMENYTSKTVGPLLDDAFNLTDSEESGHQAERGDHIIIDGKTGRDIVMEEFSKQFWKEKGGPDPTFPTRAIGFYKKHAREIINKKVAAALMTGKRVEVFVPDPKTGKIKPEPAAITKEGDYDLNSPLVRPAQLTRWQKFWSKFGFYKSKVAAQESYKNTLDARERVKFYNKVSRATSNDLRGKFSDMLEAWYKKYPERRNVDLNAGHGTFILYRQSFIGAVTAILARKKGPDGKFLYTNEELFDMDSPKMIEARTEAAEEYYQRSEQGDTDYQIKLFNDNVKCLNERMDMQARKVDFTDRNLTETQSYQVLHNLSRTSYELSQDVKNLKDVMDPKDFETIQEELGSTPTILQKINDGLLAEKKLVNGMAGDKASDVRTTTGAVISGHAVRQYYAKQMREHPEVPFSKLWKGNAYLTLGNLNMVAGMDEYEIMDSHKPMQKITACAAELERAYKENPKEIADQILSGVLDQRIKIKDITLTKTHDVVDLELSTPEQAEQELEQIKAQEQHKAQKTDAQLLA